MQLQTKDWFYKVNAYYPFLHLASSSQIRRGGHLKIKVATELQIKAVLDCHVDVLLNALLQNSVYLLKNRQTWVGISLTHEDR